MPLLDVGPSPVEEVVSGELVVPELELVVPDAPDEESVVLGIVLLVSARPEDPFVSGSVVIVVPGTPVVVIGRPDVHVPVSEVGTGGSVVLESVSGGTDVVNVPGSDPGPGPGPAVVREPVSATESPDEC
jgi:hypothetical protein